MSKPNDGGPATPITDAIKGTKLANHPYTDLNTEVVRLVGFVVGPTHPWYGEHGLSEPLAQLDRLIDNIEKLERDRARLLEMVKGLYYFVDKPQQDQINALYESLEAK